MSSKSSKNNLAKGLKIIYDSTNIAIAFTRLHNAYDNVHVDIYSLIHQITSSNDKQSVRFSRNSERNVTES